MPTELPAERQTVEVNFNGDSWQRAVFRNGEFVDIYGLPLDREKIADWRLSERDMSAPQPRHGGWILP